MYSFVSSAFESMIWMYDTSLPPSMLTATL
jgi:hypothetical protein